MLSSIRTITVHCQCYNLSSEMPVRSSLLITSPADSQLFPSIAEYYANKNIPSPEWSPLLIVDFSEEDGVWLRVEGPASNRARVITVSIFGRQADGSLHPLQSFSIVYPSTGLKVGLIGAGLHYREDR
ncbi:hypothetical protein ANCCAN_10579 [Ancylostoma caninum]|uniref:Uncharacterized protein n=1 Tax=Ancylostoma caninum TaxID=29170 RepID=A0A368GGD7_ANCCA|nr:hypothetical protein ANCCAN_10579 [Ancylostoma caninum]